LIVGEENVQGNGYWTQVKAFERSFYRNDDQVEAARVFCKKIYDQA
jgi:hypothetical protein